jgi:hypothetical protein
VDIIFWRWMRVFFESWGRWAGFLSMFSTFPVDFQMYTLLCLLY